MSAAETYAPTTQSAAHVAEVPVGVVPPAKRVPSHRAIVTRAKSDPGYFPALSSTLEIRVAAL